MSDSMKEKIDLERLPKHIAIIMDGNGRWAKMQGKNRIFGHQSAIKSVREVTEAAAELGISYLTLYAFSTENWSRPLEEVSALMSLLVSTLNTEKQTLIKNNVRLRSIGDIERLPPLVGRQLIETIKDTSRHTGLTLTLAINYGARWEILNAVKEIATHCAAAEIDPAKIDAELFSKYLATSEMPDPELLIRTSGEYRISNFLLWQIAYAEMYFTPKLWPDFRREDFYQAIVNFQCRERRFGKLSEQLI